MQIIDYEKVVIGLLISNNPPTEEHRQICFELDFDRFEKPEHRLIYKSIQTLINKNNTADIGSIVVGLGENAKRVGGEALLRSLYQFPQQMTTNNLTTAARVVEVAGKLRILDGLLHGYRKQYEDFETLVMTVIEDVDNYVYTLYHKIEKLLTSNVQTTATHTSELLPREVEVVDMAGDGKIVDVLPCGWPAFEDNFIPRPGTMGVITGIASRGKTAMAEQLAIGISMILSETNQSGHVVLTELDTTKEKLFRRGGCMLAGVDSKAVLRGQLSKQEKENYLAALHYLSTLPLFFDQSQTVEEVKLQASTLSLLYGPRVFGVWDYAELFQFKSTKHMSEEQRVTGVGMAVKMLASELMSSEVLISQFNNSVLNNANLIGGPFATRNSGALYQQADWFGEVYNIPEMLNKKDEFTLPPWAEEYYAYFILHKNKDAETAIIPLTWEAHFTRFRDISLPAGQIFSV